MKYALDHIRWWPLHYYCTLLALCEGNHPVTGGSPQKGQVTQKKFNFTASLCKASRMGAKKTTHKRLCPWLTLDIESIDEVGTFLLMYSRGGVGPTQQPVKRVITERLVAIQTCKHHYRSVTWAPGHLKSLAIRQFFFSGSQHKKYKRSISWGGSLRAWFLLTRSWRKKVFPCYDIFISWMINSMA